MNPQSEVLAAAGIRMEKKDDLVYVYFDTPEAKKLAPASLPETQRGVDPEGREVWVYQVPLEG